MNKYSINTYVQAIERIKTNGCLFDTGQIAPIVKYQLHLAEINGDIKTSFDSWPIRGFGNDSGEWRRVFEFTEKQNAA